MKPKTVIVLAVLLIACVLFVVLRHADLFGGDNKGVLVFGRTLKQLDTLRITDDRGRSMAFVRDGNLWRMTEPVEATADMFAIADLVTTLQELTSTKRLPGEKAASDLTGLAEPTWTIELTADGKSFRLKVGRQAPVMGDRGRLTYVQRADEGDKADVHSVAVNFEDLLRRPTSAFRDRTVFGASVDRIAGLAVEGKHSYRLTRDGGDWTLQTAQFTAPADPATVRRALMGLALISAEDFIDDAAADLGVYGLAPGSEALSVTIDLVDPAETVELKLGNRSGQAVFARRIDRPGVVLIGQDMLARLQPDPRALREHRVVPIPPESIYQVRLTNADGVTELVRRDKGWRMNEPLAADANGPAADALVAQLAQLRVQTFHDLPAPAAAFGLDEPLVEMRLYAADGQSRLLKVGRRNAKQETVFIQIDDSPPVMELPADRIDFLLADAAGYCGTTLTALPAGTPVSRLLLTRKPQRKEETLTLQRDDAGDWQITQPEIVSANSALIERIVQQLRDLRAVQIVAIADQAPEVFARAKHYVDITLGPATDSGAGVSLRLVTLEDQDGHSGVFAWRTDQANVVVGRCDPAVYDDLTGDLRSTLIWQLDPKTIDHISIQPGSGTPLVLTRSEDGWIMDGNETAMIDAGEVETYLSGLRRLTAERFVPDSTGKLRSFGLHRPWLTVELSAGDARHRVLVADRGPDEHDHRYAAADGVEPVFVLTAETVANLSRTADRFIRK